MTETQPESVTLDYDSAAEAWMTLEMTIEAMRHNSRCQEIAYEYAKRLATEKEDIRCP